MRPRIHWICGIRLRHVPKPLFPVRFSVGINRFEVSNDGRFLVPAAVEQDASAPMTVVLNWPEMLKKK